MTLKIEKYSDGHSTTIRLIGRMHAEHLPELEKQIRESESRIVLDLEELNLVDVEGVRFLGSCESSRCHACLTAAPTYATGSAKNAIRAKG